MIQLPADTPVDWFSESARVIDGKPDARYGWADTPDGPCIVKALDLKLGPSIAGLLDHERAVLTLLRARGAPVPELLQAESPGWLATRFSGLSLRVLAALPGAAEHLSFDERLAAWVHFLRRAEVFVTVGALPIDLWDGNLVLPLTRQIAGQVMPQDAVMIDHAHTVVTGMHLRRPVMIGSHMDRIAPELRHYLEEDQARFIRAFREADAPFPQTTAAVRDLEARSAQIFTDYDADQRVQQALDDGKLDIAAAMQFATAVAIERLWAMVPPAAQPPLFEALRRMKADDPRARFASLTAASDALRRVLPALPRTGRHQYPAVRPETLKPLPLPDAVPAVLPPAAQASYVPGEGTFRVDDQATQSVDLISESDFINLDDTPVPVQAVTATAEPGPAGAAAPVAPAMRPAPGEAPASPPTPEAIEAPPSWLWRYAALALGGAVLGGWLASRGA